MDHKALFPFGSELHDVIQQDREPKKVLVLGVYASAVHARWLDSHNKTVVSALAVASEPYIFWRGENADSIIQKIEIPQQLGKLLPADQQFNGPSGITLDEHILASLGLERNDAWLCDLLPHSCANPSQLEAIKREYLPLLEKYHLPQTTIPSVPQNLTDAERRAQILSEIKQSQANVLIVLGDKPIQWFLSFFDPRWKKFSDFGIDHAAYGQMHEIQLADQKINILPIAHPRQIGRLGRSSKDWFECHQFWENNLASRILSK
jgi:uracil-DNA glycosylase